MVIKEKGMIIGECITCRALLRRDIYGDLSWFPSPSCTKGEHNLVHSDSGIEDDIENEEEIEEE